MLARLSRETGVNAPERDIRRWLAHLKADGRLTLEDLTELALLTDRQLANVWHRDIPTDNAGSHRAVLRFYAALNPLQRAQLETTGLRVRELSQPQIALLQEWKPAATASAEDRVYLRRERDSVLFSVEARAAAPQEERVFLPGSERPARD